MSRRMIFYTILIGFAVGAAWAGFTLAASGDSEYTVVGARSRGAGSVTTTLRGDPASLFGNPALIADAERAGFLLDATQGSLAAAMPVSDGGAVSFGVLNLDEAAGQVGPLSPLRIGAYRASLGYAHSVGNAQGGMTIDHWLLSGGKRYTGFSLGALIAPSPYAQFGAQAVWIDPDGWAQWPLSNAEIPRGESWNWRYGALIRPADDLRFLVEMSRGTVAFGMETDWRMFSARAGWRDSRLSAGVSANLPQGAVVHYAYDFDNQKPREGDHSLSISFPLEGSIQPAPPAPVAAPAPVPVPASPQQRQTIIVVQEGADPPKRLVASAVDRKLDIPLDARHSLRALIESHARKYGIPPELLLGIVHAESSFDPNAISKSGAVGLFQLMPGAARDMGVQLPDSAVLDRRRDPRFDPMVNADAGIRYFAHLLQRFDWNYALAIAAYNAGPGRVASDIPQRSETERYVGRVLNFYYRYTGNPEALEGAWKRIEAIETANRGATF